jgi:hypothetical protein
MNSPLPASLIYTCPYNSRFGFVLWQHKIIVKQKEEEEMRLLLFLIIATISYFGLLLTAVIIRAI